MLSRRRKDVDVDDLALDEILADVACTAPAAAPSVSPEARSHLDSVFGSYADDSNTCACPVPRPVCRTGSRLLCCSQAQVRAECCRAMTRYCTVPAVLASLQSHP